MQWLSWTWHKQINHLQTIRMWYTVKPLLTHTAQWTAQAMGYERVVAYQTCAKNIWNNFPFFFFKNDDYDHKLCMLAIESTVHWLIWLLEKVCQYCVFHWSSPIFLMSLIKDPNKVSILHARGLSNSDTYWVMVEIALRISQQPQQGLTGPSSSSSSPLFSSMFSHASMASIIAGWILSSLASAMMWALVRGLSNDSMCSLQSWWSTPLDWILLSAFSTCFSAWAKGSICKSEGLSWRRDEIGLMAE